MVEAERGPSGEAESVADARVSQGNDCYARGDVGAALEHYHAALQAAPGYARAHYNIGVALQGLGRASEAAVHYAAAVAAQPSHSKALVNWGNVLKDLGDLAAAASLYRRAADADGSDANAFNNLGSVEQERGNFVEAERCYARAAALDPELTDARYNLALLALRRGEWERGWEGYELRRRTPPPGPPFLRPAQADDLIAGRRIAVRREQGLGDQILFSTLLPELDATGASVVVETDPRLTAALRRSVRGPQFVSGESAYAALAASDCELGIASLGRYFRRGVGDFSRQPRPLLLPDPERVRLVRERLGTARRIGISWRSFQPAGRKHTELRKSFPLERFAAMEPLGVELLDLQYGEVGEERRAFDERHPGLRREVEGLDRFHDIEGVLAAIQTCDLVITTSNVTAHFAGALGKRTWLVYRGIDVPFHYWLPGADGRSLWYPDVEIVMRREWRTWEEAFEAMGARLAREWNA